MTVPLPRPLMPTRNSKVFKLKLAVTDMAAFNVNTQLPDPEQPLPLQPVKVEPLLAAADRVTVVLKSKEAEQVEPQLIPAGLLVTVPLPLPLIRTARV